VLTNHRLAKAVVAVATMALLLTVANVPSQAATPESFEPGRFQYTPQAQVSNGNVTVTWRYRSNSAGVDSNSVPYTLTKFTVRAYDITKGRPCDGGFNFPPCFPIGGDICTVTDPVFDTVNDETSFSCTGPAPDPTTIPGGVEQGVGFMVQATNSGGFTSLWSSVSPIQTVPLPPTPGAPAGVRGTAGNGSVTVNWTAPTRPGDGAITGYVVQYSDDGGQTWNDATCTGTGTSCVIPGLTNGTSYVFRVAATNEFGTGGNSATSDPVTPGEATRPGPATNVVATPTNGGAVVRWDPPNTGGSPLTGVTVEYSSDLGGSWQAATCANADPIADERCDVRGLDNGTEYLFRVRFANAFGESDDSDPSAGVTPSVEAGDGSGGSGVRTSPRFTG
jgi:hypothetical protein